MGYGAAAALQAHEALVGLLYVGETWGWWGKGGRLSPVPFLPCKSWGSLEFILKLPGSFRIKCCLSTCLKAASFCPPDPQPNEAQAGKEEAAAQGGEAGHTGHVPEGTHEGQSSCRVRLEFCRPC